MFLPKRCVCACACVCACVCVCVCVHKWAGLKVAAPGFQKWGFGEQSLRGKAPTWWFVNQSWLQLNRNWGQGGCRSLVSDGKGNMTPDVLHPPLTPTPASPLTLLPNWRTHCYVRLLTSFGASGFWSTSQKYFMCSQAWNDIQQIWYQKNQKEFVYKMVSLIPIFRA